MEAKHTPGPWIAHKTGYKGHASGAWYIYAINSSDGRSPHVAHIKQSTLQPMAANARLIAAAPDLLEALQSLIDMDISYRRGRKVEIAVQSARSAIAKATGCDLTAAPDKAALQN